MWATPLAAHAAPPLTHHPYAPLAGDGFLNMDRTNKFMPAQQAAIVAANKALTSGQ